MHESSKTVEVISYNPNWPLEFEQEAENIKWALGKSCVEIHHVGSTSVPELAAKPRIDIIAVLCDITDAIEKLESLGYKYKGEFNIPFHLGFTKRTAPQVNLHVYEVGNPEIELNLLFRDYLRTHPKDRDRYQKLKYELLHDETSHVKNKSMFRGYTLGKDEFIKSILQKAGFQRICFRFACHRQEWETIKLLRKKYFFDPLDVNDSYDWSVEHKNDLHLLLYNGTEIIGYAQIQLNSENTAMLQIFIIEDSFKTKEVEKKFMDLCILWLERKGFTLGQKNNNL